MSTPLPIINEPHPVPDDRPRQIGQAVVWNTEREAGRPEHISRRLPFEVEYSRRKDLAWLQRQFGHAAWTLRAIAEYGLPGDMFHYVGGIGDEVLITAVFHEWVKRGRGPVTMMSAYPELFQNNPDVRRLLPNDARFVELARRFGKETYNPIYIYDHIRETDCHPAPPYPIIARMCKVVNITGAVAIRPYLYLTEDEERGGRLVKRQVAIVSAGLTAKFPMRNKQWYPERFQAVVDALSDRFNFVQLGDARDPLLDGVLDLRGKTTLRQAAAVLSQSLMLVGHVGLMMHLARAVDCRGVITYGGRETPYQTGYICNENLYTPLPCSPCWKLNACDYDRECMRRVTPDMVVEAIGRQAERLGAPLPTDSYTIIGEYEEVEGDAAPTAHELRL